MHGVGLYVRNEEERDHSKRRVRNFTCKVSTIHTSYPAPETLIKTGVRFVARLRTIFKHVFF